jgi:spore germination protein KB
VLDNGRISGIQLLLLLFLVEVATSVFYLPSKIAAIAGVDAWLAYPLASLYAILVAGVVIALAKRYPLQTFTEYLPGIIGKIPGKLLATVYALVFIHLASVVLNQGTDFFHTILLPLTPNLILDLIFVLVAIYGAYLGIECIARNNMLIYFSLYLIQIAAISCLILPDLNLNNLKPLLENGFMPVIKGGLLQSPLRGELFILLMLFPYLNQKHKVLKITLLYLGVAAVLSAGAKLIVLGTFGNIVTAHMSFPDYEVARYISVANFLQNIDILIIITWVPGVILKLAVLFHSAGIAAANVLGMKNYRITLVPIAITIIILSRLMYGTTFKFCGLISNPWWIIYLTVIQLAIPALVLLIDIVQKKIA